MPNVKNYNEQGGARTVIGGSLDVASGGDLDIESGGALKIAGTQVTASAAELNKLDDVTANTTELNILDGVTATASELNYLDNDDLAAADLVKLAAVTADSTELNILDGVTANAGELNTLDGALFGATFSVGAENTTTNVIAVDVQLTDAAGTALAHRAGAYLYVSDDADGDTLASAVDGIAAGTDGLWIPIVTHQQGMIVSEADGDVDLTITKAGAASVYLAVVLPDGSLANSTVLTFAA